ncbi:P2Y purinoceptor 13-like [Archocentrus centrarchus]|uniref:P2Y purinoceptor 13-like n=1 Tax=Archocentrus centrarchus TaxID=63155 RepID=UPI0011E9F0C0|nr:P2Y purinoceptor 13-like [Archocentrus centrarchus]
MAIILCQILKYQILMMSNSTANLSSDCASSSPVTVHVVVSYLSFFMFPIALILNVVASWVSLHLPSTSTFIVYLKNLVAADLLMTLMLPLKAASMLPSATTELRVFHCRYIGVVFYNCLYTSIALMGLISLDRFFKIVKPCGKILGQNKKFSVIMSSLVWVVLFGSTVIPTIVLTDQYPTTITDDLCMSLKTPAGRTFHKYVVLFMDFLFWFVCILIVFCYICITLKVLQSFRNSGSNNKQGKKKTKLRVFLILLVFCVCFVPLHMIRIPITLNEVSDTDVCTPTWLVIICELATWVSSTNACLDPLLYIFLCREYRDKLVDMKKGICVKFHSGDTN